MSTFRDIPDITIPESVPTPDFVKSNVGAEEQTTLEAPVENIDNVTMQALGLNDIDSIDSEGREKLGEIGGYLKALVDSRGLNPTASSYMKVFDEVKMSMGLDKDARSDVVLDRIAGVVKGWKNLSFITDPKEKRSMFMRLSRMQSSAEMNRFVFEQMEKKSVWQ